MSDAPDARVNVAGESLLLLHERAVLWERTATLFIADPHFGKAAAFRAGGVPVPHGTTAGGLARASLLLARTQATSVVFLGDFLHARAGRSRGMLAKLADWRARHAHVRMTLVRGNHDRAAGDPPEELDIDCVDEPLIATPFVFAHYPRESDDGYVLAGHLHPGARLSGAGRQHMRLPCFWFGRAGAVLPAFGEFTGLAPVEPRHGDRLFVTAHKAVIEVSTR